MRSKKLPVINGLVMIRFLVLNILGHYIRFAILARNKRVRFIVTGTGDGLGVEVDGAAQAVGDVAQMAKRRAGVAILDRVPSGLPSCGCGRRHRSFFASSRCAPPPAALRPGLAVDDGLVFAAERLITM